MNIAKAIGIMAVVIGHSNSPIDNFIYLWHMPLFFFISGYFYKDNYTFNIKLLIKKRRSSKTDIMLYK
jgi:fucose 4-O-acetylase-like acetyltransferase